MNKKGKKVTEKDFNLIKTFLDSKLSYKQIHQLTGRSSSTVYFIGLSTTYQDYLKKIAEESEKKKGKRSDSIEHSNQGEITQLDRVEQKLDKLLSFLV